MSGSAPHLSLPAEALTHRFPKVQSLSSRLGGSFRKFCKKAEGRSRAIREKCSDRRGRGRQSGSFTFKKVRSSERFESADFSDEIPGRGSFLSFLRTPSNCFLRKMFALCISLYLPCWSTPPCLERQGVWSYLASRPWFPFSTEVGKIPQASCREAWRQEGKVVLASKQKKKSCGAIGLPLPLCQGFALANFLPRP